RVARDRPPAAGRPRGGRGCARDHALQAASRGGARPADPRLCLREGLGGALPAGAPEPAPAGGLPRRGHADLGWGRLPARTPPAPPAQRGAVPAAHVRARALRRLRPDRTQGHGGGDARAALVQHRSRHLDEVSYELRSYEPADREAYLGLLHEAWGERTMSG